MGIRAFALCVLVVAALGASAPSQAGCGCSSVDTTPVWRPDGSSVLYTSYGSDWSLVAEMEVAPGKRDTFRTIAPPDSAWGVWSPDGSRYAYWLEKPASVWV